MLTQFLPHIQTLALNGQVAPWAPVISPAFKFQFYKANKLLWEGPKNKIAELYDHRDADAIVWLLSHAEVFPNLST